MDRIILEDRFTTHQKLTFIFIIGGPFLLIIYTLLSIRLNYKCYIFFAVIILLYSLLVSFAFSKRGFIKINSKLYRGLLFSGRLLYKKHIDISESPKISILKFRRKQKLPFFSAARPDLAANFYTYELNILNEHHTKREEILILKKECFVDPVIEFLTLNFGLLNEAYSPNFHQR